MNNFKEKLKFVIDEYTGIIIICGAISIFIFALSIKEKSISIALYPIMYASIILFSSYYMRYIYMLNFSITRDEYFKIGQFLNLLLSVLMWIVYLLVAFMLNENIGLINAISVLIAFIFFISLGNIVSVLMGNSLAFILIAFGSSFLVRYTYRYVNINIHSIYANVTFMLLIIVFNIIGKFIMQNRDFRGIEDR